MNILFNINVTLITEAKYPDNDDYDKNIEIQVYVFVSLISATLYSFFPEQANIFSFSGQSFTGLLTHSTRLSEPNVLVRSTNTTHKS